MPGEIMNDHILSGLLITICKVLVRPMPAIFEQHLQSKIPMLNLLEAGSCTQENPQISKRYIVSLDINCNVQKFSWFWCCSPACKNDEKFKLFWPRFHTHPIKMIKLDNIWSVIVVRNVELCTPWPRKGQIHSWSRAKKVGFPKKFASGRFPRLYLAARC